MEIASTSKSRFRHSEDELDRSTQRDSTDYDDGDDDCDDDDDDDGDDDDDDRSNPSIGLGTLQSLSISSDGNKAKKSLAMPQYTRTSSTSSSSSSKMPQKKVCVWEVFKWLFDIERSMKNCLGSMTEVKSTTIFNEMDFLLRKLTDDYPKYCKSPRLSYLLSRYVREFLYTYRHLYKSFEQGKDYMLRITKLLALYTDLELCGSISGMEWDTDISNRIQLLYRIHLEFAEDFTILDVFVRMKRLNRLHRGILTLLLKQFLVKITVKEPVEVDDDVFIKYLIVFKKWLAIEESSEDKEDVRSAFLSQAKPRRTFRTNSMYAPHLPPIESDTTYNYVLMLDKKFSLQPLLQAVEATNTGVRIQDPSISQNRKPNEVVVLSDDEASTELQTVNVKMEPGTNKNAVNALEIGLIDLTDDVFEDADIPRHYISWLTGLIEKAKIQPPTVDQRPEGAVTISDVILVDEPTESGQIGSVENVEASVSMHVTNNSNITNTADKGLYALTSARKEVGTHWNSSIDKRNEMCSTSVEVHDGATHQLPTTNNQHEHASHGNVIFKSNDEKSMECNAFNVTSTDGTDGNHALPICIASGSISSCSDEAAEQLLTVAFRNQKLNDRLAASNFTDKIQMINDSTSNRSINKVTKPSDVDCTVESTSYIESTNQSDYLPQQSNMHELPTSVYKQMPIVNDKILTINFDNKKQDGIVQYTASESVDDIISSVSSNAKRIITIVHPTRHKQIQCDDDNESSSKCPQDMSSSCSSQKQHLDGSMPLSGVKTKSILSKNTILDIESDPPSNDDRSTRFAQNLFTEWDTNNPQMTLTSVASTTQPQLRRKMDNSIKSESPIVFDNNNLSVPSTIMERKTYIKKTCNKTSSTGPRIVATIKPPVQLMRPPLTSAKPSIAPISSTLLVTTTTAKAAITTAAPTQSNSLDVQTHKPQAAAATEHHVSPSKTTQTQHQPYKLFYSGTEIELGFSDIGSSLSECASPDSNLQSPLASVFCESDNNLPPHSSNVTMKLNGPSSSLPSAIVHPLGLEYNSKHATKCSVKAAADRAQLIETLAGISAQNLASSDERSSVEDTIDSCDNLTTTSSSEGELDTKYKPEYMLQIYKELGNHLKTMGFKPKSEIKTKTRTKRLMNTASRFLEAEEMNGNSSCSPEPTDENDGEGDASLPFKKRRKLPVFSLRSDALQLIKEEEYEIDSQAPSEPLVSLPSMQCEIEIAPAALPSPALPAPPQPLPPATNVNISDDTQAIHMERLSYPPNRMLSIANIVEYLPVRAYSTFKTPADHTTPEMAPVRFNIVPQQTMVINNAPPANVLGATNAALSSTPNVSTRSSTNQEFGATFNLIPPPPPSQNVTSNQTSALGGSATANVISNNSMTSMNCGIIASDLTPSMQAIAPDNTAAGFNVAQYHQTFHSNSPFATTYSIQPAHTTNPNSLPPNFDLQNMFNLRNYQMNPQHYHNLMQNSRINFQEKKSVLLNDYMNSSNNMNAVSGQENVVQSSQQQLQASSSHVHMQSSVDAKAPPAPINKSMALRTKAARKMVAENVTVAAISTNDKLSTVKSNRVTRSSIRTTRAQNVSTEQKSPRRKTNRHR